MLKLIVQIAVSPFTIGILLFCWGWELFWMIWQSATGKGAGSDHHGESWLKYWEQHRTASFVWLTLMLLGYFAHWFKKTSLGYYGLLEVIVGLVGGSFAVAELPMNDSSTWLAMGGASYVMVRGAEHISEALSRHGSIHELHDF